MTLSDAIYKYSEKTPDNSFSNLAEILETDLFLVGVYNDNTDCCSVLQYGFFSDDFRDTLHNNKYTSECFTTLQKLLEIMFFGCVHNDKTYKKNSFCLLIINKPVYSLHCN